MIAISVRWTCDGCGLAEQHAQTCSPEGWARVHFHECGKGSGGFDEHPTLTFCSGCLRAEGRGIVGTVLFEALERRAIERGAGKPVLQ